MTERGSAPRGPVQDRLLQVLAGYSAEPGVATGIADRSTLGPCTLILRPENGHEVDLDGLATWLGQQQGVDLVASKTSHLHVRVQTEALRTWFFEGSQEAAAAAAPTLQPVTIAAPAADSPSSLDWSRKAVVARSVAALLEDQGQVVSFEASADEHVWLRPTEPSSAPGEAGPLRLDVAQVDARHDRLRARHGGTLTLEDLRTDIREDAITLEGRERDDRYADALVSYLMTQAPRERRLGLDHEKVGQKQAELDEVLAVRGVARAKSEAEAAGAPGLSEAAESAVQALIGQLEAATAVTARATRFLDPAPANRFLRSLAQAMQAAEDELPSGDPLWAASLEAFESALHVAAPGVDQGVP